LASIEAVLPSRITIPAGAFPAARGVHTKLLAVTPRRQGALVDIWGMKKLKKNVKRKQAKRKRVGSVSTEQEKIDVKHQANVQKITLDLFVLIKYTFTLCPCSAIVNHTVATHSITA